MSSRAALGLKLSTSCEDYGFSNNPSRDFLLKCRLGLFIIRGTVEVHTKMDCFKGGPEKGRLVSLGAPVVDGTVE